MTSDQNRPIGRREAMAGAAAIGLGGLAAGASAKGIGADDGHPNRLAVLWTSADPDVAHRVALMYTHAAKRAGWFGEVRLIAWGPSQRTLVGDKDLRAKVREMQDDGVVLQACVVCADSYGIADQLREIGFEVLPMGVPLTRMLKEASTEVVSF